MRIRLGVFWASLTAIAGLAQGVHAQLTLTPGNLVVVRVGDGTTALSTAAAPVSLLSVNPTTGAVANTYTFPSTGTDAFTNRGDTTTGGFSSLSQNGQYLYLAGYNAAAGTAAVDSSAVSRVVARVGPDGAVDTSTRFTFSGATRGVASAGDGTAGIYVVGENRVSVVPFGGATATQVQTGNLRAALVADNRLLVSSGSGTAPFSRGIAQYDPLPTGAATATNLITQPTGNGLTQFIALDRNAGVAGVDTIYAADRDAGTIDKYSFDGAAWTARGTLSATVSGNFIRGLTAVQAGSNVDIYYTNGTELRRVTDQAAFNADISALGADALVLAAGANYQFQGVSLTPVPEPTTIGLIGAVVFGGGAMLRRKLFRQASAEPVTI